MHIPVIRKAHQDQFCATPPLRTKSAIRFGVSVEKVVATIDVPNSHQGSFRPERKNSSVPEPARRAKYRPIARAVSP